MKYRSIQEKTRWDSSYVVWARKTDGRQTDEQTHTQKQTNKQSEVTGPSGQSYAVAKQPGDSSKEPLHGRFPRLCEGIHSLVCVHARMCVCVSVISSVSSKLVLTQWAYNVLGATMLTAQQDAEELGSWHL